MKEDKEIIALLKKVPADGLWQLILKYRALAAAIISRILTSEQDIEECIQDTFVNVWRHADTLSETAGNLKGYVACTARNTAISSLRRKGRGTLSFPDLDEIADEENDLIASLARKEDTAVLQMLVSDMEEPDREILIRHYFFFEKLRDIAFHFSMEENQIKKRLYRARQKLKKALVERGVAR